MKKFQIYIRRDKFARERPGPRELRRPPSPPSSYWRPPPSRPPPRAYPYPPPSVPREVSSKTAILIINLMILLPQIHLRLINNISLFVPHRQPYLVCRCHCPVKGTSWGTSCPSWKKWESIIFRRTSKQATEDAGGN